MSSMSLNGYYSSLRVPFITLLDTLSLHYVYLIIQIRKTPILC